MSHDHEPENDPVYLDTAATTRPLPEVVEAVCRAMTLEYGNPSARHRLGWSAARLVSRARATLAGVIGARESEIVFTGGGSEANNLALKGAAWAYRRAGDQIVVSAVEHPSVLESAAWIREQLGFEVIVIPVDRRGLIDPSRLEEAVGDRTILVSLMHVNNEVGAVQPVAEVGRRLRARSSRAAGRRRQLPLFHVDAVQSLGRLPIAVDHLGVDLLSVSGHKVHGPKGVGALYARDGVRLAPLIHGGGHEAGRRSGTENVPGIAGFGAALEALPPAATVHGSEAARATGKAAELRRGLIAEVRRRYPEVVVNGPEDGPEAAPHIISLSFPGVPGEVMQHHLEQRGVFVSTGSACSSQHRGRPSHVLEAMGCPPAVAGGAVRLSLSWLTTEGETRRAAQVMSEVAREIRATR